MRERFVVVALAVALVGAALPPVGAPAQELADLPTLSLVPVDTLRLPARGVRGIAFRDSTAWLLVSSNTGLSIPESDYQASILALHLASGRVQTLLTERRAFEAGLTFDGDRLIAGGNGVGGQEALYVIDRSRGAIIATLPASGYHPGGLVSDKAHLWQVDADARQFARIESAEGQISRRYMAPGFYPTGLAHDGFHFWNADAATGRIYRIRAHNGRADAVVAAESFLRPGEFVTLGWDGGRLWAVSAADDYAVRYSVPR
jgi:hypothetical protein